MKKKQKPSEQGLASIEMAKLAHEIQKKVSAIEAKFNVIIAYAGNYKIDKPKPKVKPVESEEDYDE